MALLVVLCVLGVALYWLKVRADSIEDDCQGMVDPSSREPYGSRIWAIVTGRSD